MKNAEYVNVFFIQTDIEAIFIPREVVQDGVSTNADKFTKKIYFKQQKNVRVDYSLNLTAEEKLSKSVFDFLTYSRKTGFLFSY